MERKKVLFLFLFVVLILVLSSCHPRHVSDIRPNMTKEEVVSLWGRTDLITYRTVNGKTVETWEYPFLNSKSICWVTFSQDRVVSNQCRLPFAQRLFRATIEPFETQPKLITKPPGITHAFAIERAYYGYIWKIYIEAEAGDRDMSRIALVVDEPGIGRYPTDWIILKPQYQKHLKGYIQWNTHSASGHLQEWTLITLKVSIIDKAGHESNEVVFPFTFESGVKNPYQYKLPAPFDQGDIPRLGYIDINLFPPGGMGDRHSRFR